MGANRISGPLRPAGSRLSLNDVNAGGCAFSSVNDSSAAGTCLSNQGTTPPAVLPSNFDDPASSKENFNMEMETS